MELSIKVAQLLSYYDPEKKRQAIQKKSMKQYVNKNMWKIEHQLLNIGKVNTMKTWRLK